MAVDLGLVKLPEDALMFPNPPTLTEPRHPRNLTKKFLRKARSLGFKKLRLHDLRGSHETLLLDSGVPVHVVAARCGHDPAILLHSYAKRTRKADTSAAAVIGNISKAVGKLKTVWVQVGSKPPNVLAMFLSEFLLNY